VAEKGSFRIFLYINIRNDPFCFSKEVYIGEVHSEKRMNGGKAEARLRDSSHKAKGLMGKDGTVKTVQNVEAADDWKKTAKDAGIPESSARNRIAKTAELDAAAAAKKKYKGYSFLSSTSLTEEKAKSTRSMFDVDTSGRKSTIKAGGGWMNRKEFAKHMKKSTRSSGSGGRSMLALGAAGILLAEMSGGNQAQAEVVGDALQTYGRDPNYSNSNFLAIEIGNSFPVSDSQVLMLGQALYEQGKK
jgi:hypothetical protein